VEPNESIVAMIKSDIFRHKLGRTNVDYSQGIADNLAAILEYQYGRRVVRLDFEVVFTEAEQRAIDEA